MGKEKPLEIPYVGNAEIVFPAGVERQHTWRVLRWKEVQAKGVLSTTKALVAGGETITRLDMGDETMDEVCCLLSTDPEEYNFKSLVVTQVSYCRPHVIV